ncbi:ATP-dependent DNA helicase RecQ [Corynebacterium sp.]|uniref:RecQ family ATP-dependent DNA helicase n=1 Tax=Corynebacterium sp. TaxID=1720 RepID=UPI0026DB4A6F|nr:ATP-dependent DNA helicase RecQ [Corynebacterium sp.]MDO4610436.1 ATP-dependent DNA helicase RecQ [Corynebacterium sp.]
MSARHLDHGFGESPGDRAGDLPGDATREEADELLHGLAGPSACLRDDQWRAIDGLVNRCERMLVVQRTGWGKSAVYFISAKLLRRRGLGAAVIISPLLALMRNQVEAARRVGIVAETVNSSNMTEWDEITARVARGEVDVLLVSPERLNNPQFRDGILPRLAQEAAMVVVDEAHCISDWGHDFRPDYRRIRDLLAGLPEDTPVLATTATANDRVVEDVRAQLGPCAGVLRGGLDRESLHLSVVTLDDSRDRPAWLATHLGGLRGSGIIYCLTVSAAEDLANALRAAGYEVAAYTGRTDADERERLERALLRNEVTTLVATSALGMGFDKPDLGFVVHVGAPSSPIAYYQQIGRAGRGTDRADVILLPGAEDREIWEWFASVSFPPEPVVRQLIAAVEEASADGSPVSTARLEAVVDLPRARIDQALKVLDVDGAVQRVRGGWIGTGTPWEYDATRYEGLAAARRAEQDAMEAYERLAGDGPDACRMLFLRRQLNDPTARTACGRCDNCTGARMPLDIDPGMARAVGERMAVPGVPLDPRRQWPTGMDRLGVDLKGKRGGIGGLREGRALGRLNDIARGPALVELLRDASWRPQPNRDWRQDRWLRLIVEVLAAWDWEERPVGVVTLGSPESPDRDAMTRAYGAAVAGIGRMADLGHVPVRPGAGPVEAQNSPYRVARLLELWDWASLDGIAARTEGLDDGPLLLVADEIGTGWSVTVAGARLHEATGRAVVPFALAAKA